MYLPSIEEYEMACSHPDYLIGMGCDRYCYRVHNSKWVYKQEKFTSPGSNRREYANYLTLKENSWMLGSICIPEMHLLTNNVIAAEYVSGYLPGYYDEFVNSALDEFCHLTNLWDTQAKSNIRVVLDADGNKKIYIIDLADVALISLSV